MSDNDLQLLGDDTDICPECDERKSGVRFQIKVLHTWAHVSFLCREHFLVLANSALKKPGSWMVCECVTREKHCDNCHCDKCCEHCRTRRAAEGSWSCSCPCCGRVAGPLTTRRK